MFRKPISDPPLSAISSKMWRRRRRLGFSWKRRVLLD
jgi:hypothetical protein